MCLNKDVKLNVDNIFPFSKASLYCQLPNNDIETKKLQKLSRSSNEIILWLGVTTTWGNVLEGLSLWEPLVQRVAKERHEMIENGISSLTAGFRIWTVNL